MHGIRTVSNRIFGGLLAAMMAVAVVNVLWQVLTRFVIGRPSSFTEEGARYLLVWISVTGAAYAVGNHSHLAIDLLPGALSHRRRLGAALALLVNALVLAFALSILVIGGARFVDVTLSRGETSPAFGLKVGYIYAALPLAGLIMMFYATLNTIDELRRRSSAAPSDPSDDSSARREPE